MFESLYVVNRLHRVCKEPRPKEMASAINAAR